MFDNANPYTLRTEVAEGMTRYFISFKDGQAIMRETEVSRLVYLEFLRFVKAEEICADGTSGIPSNLT